MCAVLIWLVGEKSFTDEFVDFTRELLGTIPERTEVRVRHQTVRANTVAFTLICNQCDCTSVIGTDASAPNEITAEQWLGWLDGLRTGFPHARLSFIRAWNVWDAGGPVKPTRVREVGWRSVDEDTLRGVRAEELVNFTR